jgi:hypothetical protein
LMNELFCCFFFHDGVLYIILVMHACVYELWRIWMLWETPLWEVYFGFSSMCCLECHLQLCYLLDLTLLD